MITTNLTKKQAEVLTLFRRHQKATGRTPTGRELAAVAFTSESSVHRMLKVLVKKGYLKKGSGQSWFNYEIHKESLR